MNIKNVVCALILGAMCVGFTACDEEEPVFDIVLMTDNLVGATATLSQNRVGASDDGIMLTIKPNYAASYWETPPTIEVVNATKDNVTEVDGVYSCKIIGFGSGNPMITITGVSKRHYTATLSVDGLHGATATLSKESEIKDSDTIILTITPTDGKLTIPTVTADSATVGIALEKDNVYTYRLTDFKGNTTISMLSETALFTATLDVTCLRGATATLSKYDNIKSSDKVTLTITSNYSNNWDWSQPLSVSMFGDYFSSDDFSFEELSNGVYTCTLTDFLGNSTIRVSGWAININISDPTGSENRRDYVDLGLPSGTLWATCNVGLGATEPQHNGAYYAWGETDSYSSYASYSYEWYEFVSEKITKYCTDSDDGYLGFTDNKTVLDLEDDAAHVNWGGTWRMPTKKEFEELFDEDNCTWGWYEKLKGVIITSKKNGNSIFLPGAGFRDSKLHYKDDYCYYWTSSLDESSPRFAYSLVIYKDAFYAAGMTLGSDQRWRGFSVRAVCKK